MDEYANKIGDHSHHRRRKEQPKELGTKTEDVQMKRKTDYVKLASYVFINEYNNRFDEDPSGVLFNKFMTLLHRDLKKEGTNIRLPHCWYRWGDVVVRYCMPYISWSHEDLERTCVRYIDHVPQLDENDKTIAFIMRYADLFMNEYDSRKESVEMIVDEVYAEAPFTFQNDFKKLRESLDIGRKKVSYNNYDEYILMLLDDVEESYPKEFNKIKKEFLQFTTIFRESVKAKAPREDLFELTEYFWFFFCYSLRLKGRCHENVPIDTIYHWRCTLNDEWDRYEKDIQIFAYGMCPNSDDPTIRKLLRDREKSNAEFDKKLDEMEGYFD